jgi:uncharacterized integral membrane protein
MRSYVWRWRRRARVLALIVAIIPSILMLVVAVFGTTTMGFEYLISSRQEALYLNAFAWALLIVLVCSPAIGILIIEKILREYYIKRKEINDGVATSIKTAYSKTVRSSKNWFLEGFRNDDDEGPPR